ncbi:ABC transporter substrate-binding protein [Sediminicoccus sp. KRV36]|uniref:ABC transporter substrate-binding protein n=1 Tax=Sediminicoccus sp. KRV36 TaxID=3133721 RepID=UPI00200D18DD|nr:ABC transporter substrate-binding protein [Sediminicoccus rosea]UPY39106.1 ABC transporter substrate-binding protein [Sediminicoccus rosea]
MRQITLQEPFRAVFYAPFYAALARNAYAAQGLGVTVLAGTQPSLAKDSVLSGVAHLAWGGPMRILLAHDADAASPLRNFGAAILGDPFFLIGRAPRPHFHLAELAGMTLGTVSEVPTPWWTLQDDIRRAGLDPASITRVTDQPMAANAAAVAEGRLDVAQLFEPFASQMARDGTGHVWHAAASRGPTSYTTFYSTAANIAEYAPEFRAMIRGLAATQSWFMAAPPEAIAATIAGYFPAMEPKLLAACIARYRALGIWTVDPHFPAESFNRLEAAMLSAGAIRRAPGYANCVDDAIVTMALAEKK